MLKAFDNSSAVVPVAPGKVAPEKTELLSYKSWKIFTFESPVALKALIKLSVIDGVSEINLQIEYIL